MNCADLELLICDYVDGTLPADQKAAVELHLAECPACAELAKDSASAVAFIESAADVEPPPELITRILFDPPWSKEKNRARSLRGRLSGWFGAVLQPKFAMGAAMTILSFSILSQLAPVRQLSLRDLEPKQVWAHLDDGVHRAWDRTMKFYDSLKFVYQIQTTLREWQQQDDEQRPAQKQGTSDSKSDVHKLPLSTPASGASPAIPGGEKH